MNDFISSFSTNSINIYLKGAKDKIFYIAPGIQLSVADALIDAYLSKANVKLMLF